MKNVYR
jgi:hypothetical protein